MIMSPVLDECVKRLASRNPDHSVFEASEGHMRGVEQSKPAHQFHVLRSLLGIEGRPSEKMPARPEVDDLLDHLTPRRLEAVPEDDAYFLCPFIRRLALVKPCAKLSPHVELGLNTDRKRFKRLMCSIDTAVRKVSAAVTIGSRTLNHGVQLVARRPT
jgi:hypothetical protein